jgi:murein L,D-transpeptidase YafK
VRTAYKEKFSDIKNNLKTHNLELNSLQIYLRAFKLDKVIEVWGKDKNHKKYQLIRTFDICSICGKPGPKRKEGDLQIPEGFYRITNFNPSSQFYLSLRVNYPNKSDKILSDKNRPGSNIYIHGDCVTLGCLPITNDKIKELYLYCLEAKEANQKVIPITFFPTKMTDENLDKLTSEYGTKENKGLWKVLQEAYDYFNIHKQLPTVGFLKDGAHYIK